MASIRLNFSNSDIKRALLIESEKISVNNLSLDKLKCRVCLINEKDNVFMHRELMRQHIGQHIIKQEVIKHHNLCGFCGTLCGSNNSLEKKSGAINSGCDHVHFYSPGAAAKSSGRSPCTNRLVFCPSCEQIIWSYNIGLHYAKFHSDIDSAVYEKFEATRGEFTAVLNFGVKIRKEKHTDIVFKDLGIV